jgi:hypothetical protein
MRPFRDLKMVSAVSPVEKGRPVMLRSILLGLAVSAGVTVAALGVPAAPRAQEGAPTPTAPGQPATPNAPTSTTPQPPSEPNPCLQAALHLHCPALIMSAPFELHLDRATIPGRVLLRASSSINNYGKGPIELRARRTGPHTTVVYQAIYDRDGAAHLYRTAAKLTFKYIPGERYEYGNVGAASYWKLKHAAGFQLWSIDQNYKAIQLVRGGPKIDYCLRDLRRTRPSSDSPREAVYPACSQDPGMRRDVLGTSVGWSDVYPYSYPEQWIDVTGLQGRFAYVQIVDPDNLLFDSNPQHKVSETYIGLPSGRILGHRAGVAAP